jgi:FMN phosphatase YigB (HAD superfamily)
MYVKIALFMTFLVAGFAQGGLIASHKSHNKSHMGEALWATLQPMTPQNTLFFFDLHGVISHTSSPDIWAEFSKNVENKGVLLSTMAKIGWNGDWAWAKKQTKVFEFRIDVLTERYPILEKYKQNFISLTNAQKPNEKMVRIIKELRNKGFTIVLASNIGPKTLEDFKVKFPEVAALFDDMYIIDKKINFYGKPDSKYFEGLKQFALDKGHAGKQMVFTDDDQENIDVSVRKGFFGTFFTGADAFEKLLKTYGALA